MKQQCVTMTIIISIIKTYWHLRAPGKWFAVRYIVTCSAPSHYLKWWCLFSGRCLPYCPGLNIGMAIHIMCWIISKTKLHFQIRGFAGHLDGINMEASRQVCKSYFLLYSRRKNFSSVVYCLMRRYGRLAFGAFKSIRPTGECTPAPVNH